MRSFTYIWNLRNSIYHGFIKNVKKQSCNFCTVHATPQSSLPPIRKAEHALQLKSLDAEKYVEQTLIPHLENQIVHHSHTFVPAQLLELTIAYSKLPIWLRQRTLSKVLVESVQSRIPGFRAEECVQILDPLHRILPDATRTFSLFIDHIKQDHIFKTLNPLQCLGLFRVLAKLQPRPDEFLADVLVPKLEAELQKYDSVELCDILQSLVCTQVRNDPRGEYLILMILGPLIEQKYNETSLVHTLRNLHSFMKLRIIPESFILKVIHDLKNPIRVKKMPASFLANALWIFARFGRIEEVLPALLPFIQRQIDQFKCQEFARLAQALPSDSQVPLMVCQHLKKSLKNMTPNEFSFFFLGCIRQNFFPKNQKTTIYKPDSTAAATPNALQFTINHKELFELSLEYINQNFSAFKVEEAIQIIRTIKNSIDYIYILDFLPKEWDAVKEDVLVGKRQHA